MAVLPGARALSIDRDVLGNPSDGTAKLFTFGGELERTFEVGSSVLCVAALPDGVHFVVGLCYGSNQGEVWLYNVDGTRVHTFTGHSDWVVAVAVTPDGQHIISGSCDKLVKVWSVASKSLVSTCAGHAGDVNAVAAMPDGQRFLSGSEDRTVRVWRLNGTLKKTFELHTPRRERPRGAARQPARALRLGRQDRQALQRQRRRRRAHLHAPHRDGVTSLALLPDGLRFVSGSGDETARIAYHGLAPAP